MNTFLDEQTLDYEGGVRALEAWVGEEVRIEIWDQRHLLGDFLALSELRIDALEPITESGSLAQGGGVMLLFTDRDGHPNGTLLLYRDLLDSAVAFPTEIQLYLGGFRVMIERQIGEDA
jgi:hypothetical protein